MNTDPESGEATVEFIALALVILIPIAYFIIAMSSVQSAVFASEAAAREATRILANDPAKTVHVQRQIDQIFVDYKVESAPTIQIECEPQPCANARTIGATVSTDVKLPLIPDAFRTALSAQIPVSAQYLMPVSTLSLVRSENP